MGMSASLPCFGKINTQARAYDLDILWKRGGENVYQLHKNIITYGPRFKNRTSVSPEQALYGNMSLTIRQARFSDEGDYQCFYSSPKESGNPDSASLFVTGHPTQNLTVKAGVLLSIPLYTADPVRVTYSAGLGSDEVLIFNANKGPARYEERCAQRCELLAQNYTLLLRGVTLEDAGVYKVTDPETKKTIGSVSLHVSVDPDGNPGPQTSILGIPKGCTFPNLSACISPSSLCWSSGWDSAGSAGGAAAGVGGLCFLEVPQRTKASRACSQLPSSQC
ncbi:uncharacterized protein LOC118206667 [Anguilla anguilla]|uniref:uncharacterized protein LOC118206667 n=1 Tax=Anguilla anguilla TaxID=7936 RepID=UPI0015B1852C|nr:uncharacterized protein LOC118206667 [Anguilla anguilla]